MSRRYHPDLSAVHAAAYDLAVERIFAGREGDVHHDTVAANLVFDAMTTEIRYKKARCARPVAEAAYYAAEARAESNSPLTLADVMTEPMLQ
jgi:hypothetical protein